MNNNGFLFDTALDLIYLVSCSVNKTAPEPARVEAMNLQNVFRLAKKHSLTTAAAFAVEQAAVLPDYFLEAKSKAVRKLALYDIERKRVTDALESNKIWYAPLKGSVLKWCYPKTAMREMTDVDILCDSSRMEDVSKIMQELGFSCKQFGNGAHDTYVKPPAAKFDMHRTLFAENRQPLLSEYYRDVKNRLLRCENLSYGYHMTVGDLYIYVLCHLYKHYRFSGTGLRSLLDIYVFNKTHGSALNSGYINTELEKLGLKSFEAGIRSLAIKVFNGKHLNQSEKDELMLFVESGSHGSYKNYTLKALQSDNSKNRKTKYLIKRVFPDKETVKANYPVVYRHSFLYPALIIYRPVKGLIIHPKKLLREFRRVKNYRPTENKGR